ncbi:MAG: hypothetical protein KF906_09730 [Actinobacteria bacterium]|nr:hypothetical protein [Actinomycetota bacterium]
MTAALCVVMTSFAAPAEAESDGTWDYVSYSVSGVYFPIVGNFAGDKASDIYWYAPGAGVDTMYVGNEGSRTFDKVRIPMDEVATPIVGDFAGDDYDDIFWYRAGTAVDRLWVSEDTDDIFDTSITKSVSGTYQPKVLRDWRAEGKDRIFWYRPGDGTDPLWIFDEDGSHRSISQQIRSNLQVIAGDWNGDLVEDLFLYGPGSLPDRVWISHAGPFTSTKVTINGSYEAVPVIGDEYDDVLLYGSGTKPDRYLQNLGGHFRILTTFLPARGYGYSFGMGGAVVYSPADRENALWTDGDSVITTYLSDTRDVGSNKVYGQGDFDGDGFMDILWYGPGTGSDAVWYWDAGGDAGDAAARSAEGAAPTTGTVKSGVPTASRD